MWITELLVIPQNLFCGHLRDSTGVRAHRAGIYEKQEAIKVLILKETEERHDSPTSTCYGQAKGWLAFATKSSKSQILGIVFNRQRHSPLGYTGPFPTLRKLWTKSFVRNSSEQGLGFSRTNYHLQQAVQWLGWEEHSIPKGIFMLPLSRRLSPFCSAEACPTGDRTPLGKLECQNLREGLLTIK